MEAQERQLSRERAKRMRLWLGLFAIGLIVSIPGRALAQRGLHVVSSPFINNSSLNGVSAIAGNDIWAVGVISGRSDVTLAEHFNGTSWSVVSTPTVKSGLL